MKAPEVLLSDQSIFFVMKVFESAREDPAEAPCVRFVDTLYQSMLVGKDLLARERALEHLRECFASTLARDQTTVEVIFFPLHASGHWSLLAYFARVGPVSNTPHWVHYDSMPGAHVAYCNVLVQALMKTGVIPSDKNLPNAIKRPGVPRQLDGWECGFYVLMYMRWIIRTLRPLTSVEGETHCAPNFLKEFREMLVRCVRDTRNYYIAKREPGYAS